MPPTPVSTSPLIVALRQSAALLGATGLCVIRQEVDGGLRLIATEGEAIGPATAAAALDGLGGAGDIQIASGEDLGTPERSVGAIRLADDRHALLAVAPEALDPSLLRDGASLVAALLRVEIHGVAIDHARFYRDLSAGAAALDERLSQALQRASTLLGTDAAVLLCVEAEEWRVESIVDPDDIVDVDRLLASGALASTTYRSSGAVGIHDVAASPFNAPGGVGAFLGAPIVSGRHGLGVLAFLGRDARSSPFVEAERVLVETLARWAGVVVAGGMASRRLDEKSAVLKQMFEASPYPIGIAEWVENAGAADDLEIMQANDPAVRLLGVGAGDRLSIAFPPAVLRLWTGACRRAINEGTPQRFRADVLSPGEPEPRRLSVALAITTEAEETGGGRVLFFIEDVTARRPIREHLHDRDGKLMAVLDHAPILLFELDDTGTFVFCQGHALEMSGIRADDLLGTSAFDRYRGHPQATQALGRVLAGEDAAWSLSLGSREFDVFARPIETRDGTATGARGVAVDVTERTEAERLLDSQREDAAVDSRHSADLVALLSHGLRVPLATVIGFADVLVEDDAVSAPEAGGAIQRAATEIMETLDGFLDLTHLSALRTASPTAIGTAGVRACLESALAEGASGVPASLHLEDLADPVLLDIDLVGALVRRVASLAESEIDVRAEVRAKHLMIRIDSPGVATRLGADTIDTAYVYHAAAALDAELALGSGGSVGLGIPLQLAPIVALEPVPSEEMEMDLEGALSIGWASIG